MSARTDWKGYHYYGPTGYEMNKNDKEDKSDTREIVKVWIQGNVGAGQARAMLAQYPRIRFRPSNNIIDADIVLYMGGADVNPALYGENRLQCSSVDTRRDMSDQACYHEARKHDIFQVGICRGSQFLNVMNGGTLWQDVDNHAGNPHLVQDTVTKKTYEVSSTHHQQSILHPKKAKLLAFASEAERKISAGGGWRAGLGRESVDVEAYWYPDTRCLGVQWHPEFGPPDCTNLFFEYIEKYRNQVLDDDISFEVDRAVG